MASSFESMTYVGPFSPNPESRSQECRVLRQKWIELVSLYILSWVIKMEPVINGSRPSSFPTRLSNISWSVENRNLPEPRRKECQMWASGPINQREADMNMFERRTKSLLKSQGCRRIWMLSEPSLLSKRIAMRGSWKRLFRNLLARSNFRSSQRLWNLQGGIVNQRSNIGCAPCCWEDRSLAKGRASSVWERVEGNDLKILEGQIKV